MSALSALRRRDSACAAAGCCSRSLDLELAPGEALQITGPNGSGKSSLIRLAGRAARAAGGGTFERRRSRLPTTLWHSTASCRSAERWASGCDRSQRGARGIGLARACAGSGSAVVVGPAEARALARVAASGAPLWLLDEPLNALDADGVGALDELSPSIAQTAAPFSRPRTSRCSGDWRSLELQA